MSNVVNKQSKKPKKGKGKKSQKSKSEHISYHSTSKANEVADTENAAICEFCHFSHSKDLLECGKMYRIGEIHVHYFCVLFSANGEQNGEDDEGVYGFLLKDIKTELRRAQKLRCQFCNLTRANARCSRKGCNAVFHYRCGQENDCIFQFTGKFKAFCGKHRVKQNSGNFPAAPDRMCVVCHDEVSSDTKVSQQLMSPCCGRHFHAPCIQEMAKSYGTQHFRCPYCNNKNKFIQEILRLGVYIPQKDAAWEEDEAFYNYQEHYVQSRTCQLQENCLCKEGPKCHKLGTQWEVILCDWCGSKGVHVECGQLDKSNPEFGCSDCAEPDKWQEKDVTRLAYNVDCKIDICRLPAETPKTVLTPMQPVNSKALLRGVLKSKVTVSKSEIGYTLVSCNECGKCIPLNFLSTLIKHLETHENKPQVLEKDTEESITGVTGFVTISIKHDNEKKYHCLVCNRRFKYLTRVRRHFQEVHSRSYKEKDTPSTSETSLLNKKREVLESNLPSTSPTIEYITCASSDNEEEDIKDLISSEESDTSGVDDDERKSDSNDSNKYEIKYKPGPKSKTKNLHQGLKHGPKSKKTPKLYITRKPLDISSLGLNELLKVKEEESFIGDITYQERRILFLLWRHIDTLDVLKGETECPQCQRNFVEHWQLCQHLSSECTSLFDQFLESVRDQFADAGVTPYIFEFLKEKLFMFFGQRWCLLCGRSLDERVTYGFSLQTHLLYFHLYERLLDDVRKTDCNAVSCTMPSKTYVDRNCGRLFPNERKSLIHLVRDHSRMDQLLREDTSQLAVFTGTMPARDPSEGMQQCPKCGLAASNSSSLKIHLAGHKRHAILEGRSGGGKCSVEDCDYVSRFSQEELVRHYGQVHVQLHRSSKSTSSSGGNKRVICPSFTETKVEAKGGGTVRPKPFQCIQCYKAFFTNEELKVHKKVHLNTIGDELSSPKEREKPAEVKPVPEVVDLDSDEEINEVVSTEETLGTVENFLEPARTLQISDVRSVAKENTALKSLIHEKVKMAMEKAFSNVTPSASFAREQSPSSSKHTLPQNTATKMNVITPSAPALQIDSTQASKPPPKVKRNNWRCPVCQAAFRSCSNLKSHMANLHFWSRFLDMVSESSPFVCAQKKCRKLFPSRERVAHHLVEEHEDLLLAYAQHVSPRFTFDNEGSNESNDVIEVINISTESCDPGTSRSTISSNPPTEQDEVEYIGCDAGEDEDNEILITSDGDNATVDEYDSENEVVISDEIIAGKKLSEVMSPSRLAMKNMIRKAKNYESVRGTPSKIRRYEDLGPWRGIDPSADVSNIIAPSACPSRIIAPSIGPSRAISPSAGLLRVISTNPSPSSVVVPSASSSRAIAQSYSRTRGIAPSAASSRFTAPGTGSSKFNDPNAIRSNFVPPGSRPSKHVGGGARSANQIALGEITQSYMAPSPPIILPQSQFRDLVSNPTRNIVSGVSRNDTLNTPWHVAPGTSQSRYATPGVSPSRLVSDNVRPPIKVKRKVILPTGRSSLELVPKAKVAPMTRTEEEEIDDDDDEDIVVLDDDDVDNDGAPPLNKIFG